MRGHRAAAPLSSRARARGAVIGAFVVVAALVPATATAAGTQEVDAAFPYLCALPSGKQPAQVRISAVFPERAEPGEPVEPAGVTTTVELPAEAVADLAALGAATARPATRLTVGGGPAAGPGAAPGRGGAGAVLLPGSGRLALTTTGDVASVTGHGSGDLTFSAGSLAVDLALATADGTAAGTGALTVDCSP
ncbi:DUF6801 domain-containing protein, partial [Streptomyces pilosus]